MYVLFLANRELVLVNIHLLVKSHLKIFETVDEKIVLNMFVYSSAKVKFLINVTYLPSYSFIFA